MGNKSSAAATREGLEEGDIEALISLVMMLAAKDAREDLKRMMEELKEANRRKAEWRKHRDCRKGYALAVLDDATRIESLSNLLADTLDDFAIDEIKRDIASMSELGEMESLRLQMAMDRLSKLMSTLSNLLKKIADTADDITRNMK